LGHLLLQFGFVDRLDFAAQLLLLFAAEGQLEVVTRELLELALQLDGFLAELFLLLDVGLAQG
jgi:hypothetical protein